ncbi:protein sidekick-2-like isoform X2 [Branchiostoma floridae x Branchiostoma belcheri]
MATTMAVVFRTILLIYYITGITTADNLLGPSVQTEPEDDVVLQGNSKNLACVGGGSSPLEYRWLKDGQERTGFSTSTRLRLTNVSPQTDAGEYRCIVKNQVGMVLSKKAQLDVAFIGQFPSSPTSESVDAGQPKVLSCPPIDSVPVPRYSWFIDNTEVVTNTRTRFITVDGRLVLLSSSGSDSRQYKCKASNDDAAEDRFSQVITLSVRGSVSSTQQIQPTIVIPPIDQNVERGSNQAVFECVPNANPINSLTITWKKDGQVVTSGLSDFNRKLTINFPTDSDEGIYKCEARLAGSSYSPASAYANLTIYDEPVFYRRPPVERRGNLDHSTDIQCQATGTPQPTIKWYYDAVDIASFADSNKYQVQTDGTLRIMNLGEADQGMYQCFAENAQGSVHAATRLIVQSIAPNIIDPPAPTSVVDGSVARMRCSAEGAPRPTITWYKGAAVLGSVTLTDDVQVGSTDGPVSGRFMVLQSGELLISPARKEDSGSYRCTASNSIGSVSANATLTVQIQTEITSPPRDPTEVIKGQTAVLECGVSHDTSISIHLSWWKDGEPIRPDSRYIITAQGSLQIRSVFVADVGIYTCNVTSAGGNDSASAYLLVKELPHKPTAVTAVLSTVENRAIVLTWDIPFDGNTPIERFVLEVKEDKRSTVLSPSSSLSSEDEDWSVMQSSVDPATTRLVLRNLRPSMGYQFRIKAVNRIGDGPFSDPTPRVRLPNEVPDAPPQGVLASARDTESIMLEWRAPPEENQNGDLYGYIISYNIIGLGSYPDERNITDPAATSYVLDGLIVFTEYEIRIAAYNIEGVGVYSNPITQRTAEGVPTRAPELQSITSVNSSVLELTWRGCNTAYINGINQGYKMKAWGFDRDPLRHPANITQLVLPGPNLQTEYMVDMRKFTRYRIGVLCYTSVGDGPLSNLQVIRTLEDYPGPVDRLRFTEVIDESFLVSWRQPQDVNGVLLGYEVGVQEFNLTSTRQVYPIENDTLQYRVTGLTRLTKYEIDVRARTRVGLGPAVVSTITSGEVPERPEPPQNVAISRVTTDSVYIQFTPGDSGKTSIIEWTVEAQIGEDPEWRVVYISNDENALSLTVPNLRPYTYYVFRMKASNVVGDSVYTPETRRVRTISAPPTGKPRNVTLSPASETSLRVRWVPLSQDEWFGAMQGYLVQYNKLNETRIQQAHATDPWAFDFILEGLEEWTAYEVQVQAYNDVGSGPWTEPAVGRTRESVPSAGPDPVSAYAANPTSINVTWGRVPESDENGLILGYKVMYTESEDGNAEVQYKQVNGNNTNGTLVTGLRKFVEYDIQVLAFTRVGDGVPTDPQTIKTLDDVPGAPGNIMFPSVTFTAGNAASVTVRWDAPQEPNGVIEEYRVEYGLADSSQNRRRRQVNYREQTVGANNRSLTVTNLVRDRTYNFRITAKTRHGWGDPETVQVYTTNRRNRPSIPGRPAVPQDEVRSRQATMTWLPGSDGNSPLRYYIVQTYKGSRGPWVNRPERVDPSLSVYVLTDLQPYTTYKVRIRAANDIGESDWSLESNTFTTLQAAPSGPPTITDFYPYTTTSVKVIWRAPPANTHNGAITGYRIQYRKLPTLDRFTTIMLDDPNVRQYELRSLEKFETYEIKVNAFNVMGQGPASSTVEITTGAAVPRLPPSNVQIVQVQATTMTITWTAPPANTTNGDIQGYKVHYWIHEQKEATERMSAVLQPVTQHRLLGLRSYTTYWIQVSCFNAAGDSNRSSPAVRARTDQAEPGQPGPITFTPIACSLNELRVNWELPQNPNGPLTGYRVSYEPDQPVEGISTSVMVDVVGTQRSLHVKELREQVRYVFRVRARTTIGYGDDVIGNYTTGPGIGGPGAPSKPSMRIDKDSVFLQWTAPSSIGSSAITEYVVEKRPEDSIYWSHLPITLGAEARSAVISFDDLPDKRATYTFRVIAKNSRSCGLPSEESEFLPNSYLSSYAADPTRQYWFLIIIALVFLILLVVLIAVLCMRGSSERYKLKKSETEEQLSSTMAMDDGGFATFELNHRRNGDVHGHKHSLTRKNVYAKSPPRPSPGSIVYSDEESTTKYDMEPNGESSSLTEKPSDLGDSTSEVSESDYESYTREDPHSFVNHYASDPMYQSWKRQNNIGTKAYSYTDSEPEMPHVYTNPQALANGMAAGSRAPLPGFSSFV